MPICSPAPSGTIQRRSGCATVVGTQRCSIVSRSINRSASASREQRFAPAAGTVDQQCVRQAVRRRAPRRASRTRGSSHGGNALMSAAIDETVAAPTAMLGLHVRQRSARIDRCGTANELCARSRYTRRTRSKNACCSRSNRSRSDALDSRESGRDRQDRDRSSDRVAASPCTAASSAAMRSLSTIRDHHPDMHTSRR